MIALYLIAGITGSFLGAVGIKIAFIIMRDGASLAYANKEKPLWRSCERCDGCGVLLNGGPIPLQYRSFYRTVSNTAKSYGVIQGPLANVERCNDCLGLGSTWHYKNAARSINLPGPDFGGKWDS